VTAETAYRGQPPKDEGSLRKNELRREGIEYGDEDVRSMRREAG